MIRVQSYNFVQRNLLWTREQFYERPEQGRRTRVTDRPHMKVDFIGAISVIVVLLLVVVVVIGL